MIACEFVFTADYHNISDLYVRVLVLPLPDRDPLCNNTRSGRNLQNFALQGLAKFETRLVCFTTKRYEH
jgi:hypothetical protein